MDEIIVYLLSLSKETRIFLLTPASLLIAYPFYKIFNEKIASIIPIIFFLVAAYLPKIVPTDFKNKLYVNELLDEAEEGVFFNVVFQKFPNIKEEMRNDMLKVLEKHNDIESIEHKFKEISKIKSNQLYRKYLGQAIPSIVYEQMKAHLDLLEKLRETPRICAAYNFNFNSSLNQYDTQYLLSLKEVKSFLESKSFVIISALKTPTNLPKNFTHQVYLKLIEDSYRKNEFDIKNLYRFANNPISIKTQNEQCEIPYEFMKVMYDLGPEKGVLAYKYTYSKS